MSRKCKNNYCRARLKPPAPRDIIWDTDICPSCGTQQDIQDDQVKQFMNDLLDRVESLEKLMGGDNK